MMNNELHSFINNDMIIGLGTKFWADSLFILPKNIILGHYNISLQVLQQ